MYERDLTLKELWQQTAEQESLEVKRRELEARRAALDERLDALDRTRRAEAADVARLEGGSLAAFFYQALGRREEKLDEERQQAWAAQVRYDAAARERQAVEADLGRLDARLRELAGCRQRYQQALTERVRQLKAASGPAAQELMECETRLDGLALRQKELAEALQAGKAARRTAAAVLDALDSAEGWGTWDAFGGGFGVGLAKYSELDEAQRNIEQLQVELGRFRTELADVEINAELRATVDGFTRFADLFFDNVFTDWAVLDHIRDAQAQVRATQGEIERVLRRLKKLRADLDAQVEDERERREQIAREAGG